MNVLLLEDESRVAEVIEAELREAAESGGWTLNLRVVGHRDGALEVLNDEQFPLDLAIVDLQVPAGSAPGAADRGYGLEVMHAIKTQSRGTKMIVFSGRADDSAHTQMMSAAWTADALGAGEEEPMIEFLHKEERRRCIESVCKYADGLATLGQIDISYGAEAADLTEMDERILRIQARRFAANRMRVGLLKGGLSGSRTVRVRLFRGAGVNPFASLFAKIDDLSELEDELRAYNAHVAPRLAPGGFPQYADRVGAGAAGRGGLFFRLADDYAESMLDVLERDVQAAVDVLGRVRDRTSGWHDARAVRSMTVRDIRRLQLPDDRLAGVEPLLVAIPWQAAEVIRVETHCCSQHGDMHLLNVLVSGDGDMVLIDFARAMEAPASFDPLTLELGVAFHPLISERFGDWPSSDDVSSWWNLDLYLDDCPYPEFVRACREWAHDVAATDGEVAAVAYAYGMRQLRWPARRDRAVALIDAAVRRLS
jgi:CheY-like chemotaxis protein